MGGDGVRGRGYETCCSFIPFMGDGTNVSKEGYQTHSRLVKEVGGCKRYWTGGKRGGMKHFVILRGAKHVNISQKGYETFSAVSGKFHPARDAV